MECIICQDDTSEYLQDNTFCDCKYKIHASCWIDYVHSKTTVTCLICRKERVESKKDIASLPTIIEEQEQEQEQEPVSQNSISSVQHESSLWQSESSLRHLNVVTNNDLNRKIIKLVICVIILVFILVLIWA